MPLSTSAPARLACALPKIPKRMLRCSPQGSAQRRQLGGARQSDTASRRQDHALAHGLPVELLVGGFRLVQLEAVGDQRRQRNLVLGDEAGAGVLAELAE